MVNKGAGSAGLGPKVFFVWGTCCAFCAVFVWFFIYETKGLTLEQVDELYANVSQAWKSRGFVPAISYQEEARKASVSSARRVSMYRSNMSEGARRFSVAASGISEGHEGSEEIKSSV